MGWIKSIIFKPVSFNIIAVFDDRNFFLSSSAQNAVIHDHYPEAVQLIPVYGKQTAKDLMTHRLKGEHPWACFHPLVRDGFVAPHGQKFGALASCHDECHRALIATIPEDMRTIYCHCDGFEQELKQLICGMNLNNGQTIIDGLPHDFRMKYLASPFAISSVNQVVGNSQELPLCDKTAALDIFDTDRLMLDQEFDSFPVDINKCTSDDFIYNFCNALFHSEDVFSIDWVRKEYVTHEIILRINWTFYNLKEKYPEESIKVHDWFMTSSKKSNDYLEKEHSFGHEQIVGICGDICSFYNKPYFLRNSSRN